MDPKIAAGSLALAGAKYEGLTAARPRLLLQEVSVCAQVPEAKHAFARGVHICLSLRGSLVFFRGSVGGIGGVLGGIEGVSS